jgi:excisionase family DNA binding protein
LTIEEIGVIIKSLNDIRREEKQLAGPILDIKQVQEKLGVSERTIFRLIEKGELTGFKVGRAWRFEESDIDEYIIRQRQKAREALEQGGTTDSEAA